jgi:hypothetical protein
VARARGKSGPLFQFDVRDDIREIQDATVEKEETHAGKVLTRGFYEKHKHQFPCVAVDQWMGVAVAVAVAVTVAVAARGCEACRDLIAVHPSPCFESILLCTHLCALDRFSCASISVFGMDPCTYRSMCGVNIYIYGSLFVFF